MAHLWKPYRILIILTCFSHVEYIEMIMYFTIVSFGSLMCNAITKRRLVDCLCSLIIGFSLSWLYEELIEPFRAASLYWPEVLVLSSSFRSKLLIVSTCGSMPLCWMAFTFLMLSHKTGESLSAYESTFITSKEAGMSTSFLICVQLMIPYLFIKS